MAGGIDETEQSSICMVEIIDLINPRLKFKFEAEAATRIGAVGEILENQPIICGGRDEKWNVLEDGIILGSSNKIQLIEGRRSASSVVLDQTRIWITGGINDKWKRLEFTEFISLGQPPEKGPKLPFTVTYHSMVQVNSKTIYLIGGYQNGKASSNTWIIDPTKNFEIKEGPPLKKPKYNCTIATMKLNGKIFIIVVGEVGRLVEILDTSLPGNGWKLGM